MDKKWIAELAGDIEAKYGKESRNKLFGDIDGVKNTPKFISAWFGNFTTGMDELNDNEVLRRMMVSRCPCGGDDAEDGKTVRELYDNSKTLDEFGRSLEKWFMQKHEDGGDDIKIEFIESIICGGNECAMAVHLPEKQKLPV